MCSSLSALAGYRLDDDPAHRRLPSFVEGGHRYFYGQEGVRLVVPVGEDEQ